MSSECWFASLALIGLSILFQSKFIINGFNNSPIMTCVQFVCDCSSLQKSDDESKLTENTSTLLNSYVGKLYLLDVSDLLTTTRQPVDPGSSVGTS